MSTNPRIGWLFALPGLPFFCFIISWWSHHSCVIFLLFTWALCRFFDGSLSLVYIVCPRAAGYMSCATPVNLGNKDIWLGFIIMYDNPAKWGSQNKTLNSKIYSKRQLEWRWGPWFIIAEVFWKLSSCATSVCNRMLWSSGYRRKALFSYSEVSRNFQPEKFYRRRH